MSIRWITEIWDKSPYHGTKLLIHLGMADHANEEGWFFISQGTLSNKARCSVEYLRRTIREMQTDNVLLIEKKGHSKGRATEYRLLPNTVWELDKSNRPTLDGELSNFDTATPQLCLATTVLNNRLNTTVNDETSFKSIAHQSADNWWMRQNPRPIGKGAWHSLLKVCEASAERGYSFEQIVSALDSLGVVPSIQQMDKQLRNIKPMTARQERLTRGLKMVNELSETDIWEISQ